METFGKRMKELRAKNDLSLREFCRETGYDPSNWSKIERGLLNPPGDDILKPIFVFLGVDTGSEQEQNLLDLASIARKQLPPDISEDEKMMSMLPAFFRTIRGGKPTDDDVEELFRIIRKHTE